MYDYGFFDNFEHDYFYPNSNSLSLNESNFKRQFDEDFCYNNNKNEETPLLYLKNTDFNFKNNNSTNANTTNNNNIIINETRIEIVSNFNCKKRRRNSSPSDQIILKLIIQTIIVQI
jgi:hypothetical protein